jgi:hypothetical protein
MTKIRTNGTGHIVVKNGSGTVNINRACYCRYSWFGRRYVCHHCIGMSTGCTHQCAPCSHVSPPDPRIRGMQHNITRLQRQMNGVQRQQTRLYAYYHRLFDMPVVLQARLTVRTYFVYILAFIVGGLIGAVLGWFAHDWIIVDWLHYKNEWNNRAGFACVGAVLLGLLAVWLTPGRVETNRARWRVM